MTFLSLLQDVRPCDFERLMHFMYYGQVRIPNGDLESLIVTAKSLRIKGLSAPSTQFDHQHHHHQQPAQQQDLLPPPAIILPAPPQERLNKYASIDILISKRLKKVNIKNYITNSLRSTLRASFPRTRGHAGWTPGYWAPTPPPHSARTTLHSARNSLIITRILLILGY